MVVFGEAIQLARELGDKFEAAYHIPRKCNANAVIRVPERAFRMEIREQSSVAEKRMLSLFHLNQGNKSRGMSSLVIRQMLSNRRHVTPKRKEQKQRV